MGARPFLGMGNVCASDDDPQWDLDLPQDQMGGEFSIQACGLSTADQKRLALELGWSEKKMNAVKELFSALGNPSELSEKKFIDVQTTINNLRTATFPSEWFKSLRVFDAIEGQADFFSDLSAG